MIDIGRHPSWRDWWYEGNVVNIGLDVADANAFVTGAPTMTSDHRAELW